MGGKGKKDLTAEYDVIVQALGRLVGSGTAVELSLGSVIDTKRVTSSPDSPSVSQHTGRRTATIVVNRHAVNFTFMEGTLVALDVERRDN